MMRIRLAFWPAVIFFILVFSGCVHRPTDAIQAAKDALDDAEKSGAKDKHPVLYQQAQEHFDEGNRQLSYFRYNLARCEYEAAEQDASLAASYSQAPGPGASEPEVWPTPGCPICPRTPTSDCCAELSMCSDKNRELESELSEGGPRVIYKSRVIREECPDGEEFEERPAPSGECRLVGALLVQPPAGITPDRTDYELRVKFMASKLEDGPGRADDYRLLIDILEVEPPSVEVSSPMIDYEPISEGEWSLPMRTPEGLDQPVRVSLGVTLWNANTNKEQNLPAYKVVIPNLSPGAAAAPVKEPGKARPPAQAKPGETKKGMSQTLVAAVGAVGLLIGLLAGFLLFRGRGKSSLGR